MSCRNVLSRRDHAASVRIVLLLVWRVNPAFSNNALQVFELNYNNNKPVYNYKYALYWDMAETTFKKELQ